MSQGSGINALHSPLNRNSPSIRNENRKQKPEKGQIVGDTNRFEIIASEQPPQQNLFRKNRLRKSDIRGLLTDPTFLTSRGSSIWFSQTWNHKMGPKDQNKYPSYFFLKELLRLGPEKNKKCTNLCAHTDTHVRDDGSDQCETTTKMAVSFFSGPRCRREIPWEKVWRVPT